MPAKVPIKKSPAPSKAVQKPAAPEMASAPSEESSAKVPDNPAIIPETPDPVTQTPLAPEFETSAGDYAVSVPVGETEVKTETSEVVKESSPPKAEPPSAPLNLTVDGIDATSLSLRWKAPEAEGTFAIEGYFIEYRKEGCQEWVSVNKEPSISTHYKITNLNTGDKILVCVKAVSKAGSSEPTALEHNVLIREIVDRPKIRLPRYLRQTYVKHVGEAVNLVIPFQGKPRPKVNWTKNGQPLDPKQASVRNGDSDTILFIRKAERKDSGVYELTIQIDDLEDKAKIDIKIAERPGPPKTIKLVDVWGFNAAVEWTPPVDDGNAEITGYTVQKSDKKTGEWFTVLENYHQTNCTVSDLIIGNSYYFRVFSENLCGLSEKATVTKDCAFIKKTENTYKSPEYKDCDFAEAPKFTQPLNDRTTTNGYTTKLFCSVRGSPKQIFLICIMPEIENQRFQLHASSC
ncbi:immunoglobulin-like and fibronectin type III domain-containing protein 1 isoform X2 [Engystomops pustulosus]|uniref:immunoglobulin-like and fibronectin type III domain-containing protein 1 isoform X2 n=1 Tax=Engystomops pustulosus TaxID=76066 RepID=UPI003AFA63DF